MSDDVQNRFDNERSQMELTAILDVPVTLHVNLGNADMSITDLLSLNVGSIVELDNEVGAPIEVFVNNRLIAKGEVILVDEKLAISILEADTSKAF